MGISCKVLRLCLGLLLIKLCNGLPISVENTSADSHTQLLTGLVAVLLTICSVVLLAGCLCCQRRNGFKEFRDSPVVASSTSNLEDHGHINPVANGEFTIFTPLSPPHHNNNVFLANQQIITRTQEDYVYGDVDVSSWFDGKEKEFPRLKLKYIRELGKGWFGRVVEGAAQDLGDQPWTPVGVRILDATASTKERIVFLHDATIYRCGPHPNILRLLGRCLDTVPLLLLQEYCAQGDLKNYLVENKSTADKLLSTEYPLIWCCQLTSALKHLHDNKITHPDLAARNCQLTSNLTLKLGDYGLAVFKYPEDYYQGAPGVPVRWCSPESLNLTSTTIQPKKVTPETNIWSLGVTMWEICECGDLPYSSMSDDDVVSQVLGPPGVRLPRPSFSALYTDYIFRLMQLCWTTFESRPAIAQIDLMLSDLLQVHKNTSSIEKESPVTPEDFDRRWESLKPNTIVKRDNHVVDMEKDFDDQEMISKKPLSPSLNNLHGSLDNLLTNNTDNNQMESWLENVANKTGDMSFVRGLSDAIKDLDNTLAQEHTSSSESSHQQSPGLSGANTKPKIEFKLGPIDGKAKVSDTSNQNDSLTDSLLFVQRTSSESETEDENWKKKIERGAYSEKVRLKSKSVQDLMVLTHIDHSESESETPLPSLDYRINNNYKNVRYAVPKQNLESMSLLYASEGNLLTVQDTFEKELKLLQEKRKDSLSFVPDNYSQNNNNSSSSTLGVRSVDTDDVVDNKNTSVNNNFVVGDSQNTRILQELNSTTEIKPAKQVYNVFNVTIDKFSPIHVNKLSDIIINLEKKEDIPMIKTNGIKNQIPKLSEMIHNNSNFESLFNKELEIEKSHIYKCTNNVDDRKNLPDIISDIKIRYPDCDIDKDYLELDIEVDHDSCIPEYDSCKTQHEHEDYEGIKSNGTNNIESENHSVLSEDSVPSCDHCIEDLIETKTDNDCCEMKDICNEEKEMKYNTGSRENRTPSLISEDSISSPLDGEEPFVSNSILPEPREHSATSFPDCLTGNSELKETVNKTNIYQVPKLKDIIENNDFLMDYIIANYDDGGSEIDDCASLDSLNAGDTNHAQNQEETHLHCEPSEDIKADILVSQELGAIAFEELVVPGVSSAEASESKTEKAASEFYSAESDEKVSNTVYSDELIKTTKEFIIMEQELYDNSEIENQHMDITFDLSENQTEVMPNPLTHSSIFANVPFSKTSLQEVPKLSVPANYSSLNIFGCGEELISSELSTNFIGIKEPFNQENNQNIANLTYSLETWDNFLGKALDSQSKSDANDLFDSFSSEPQSLLFIENVEPPLELTYDLLKDSLTEGSEDKYEEDGGDKLKNSAYQTVHLDDIVVQVDDEKKEHQSNSQSDVGEMGTWEAGGGWFLHPQSTSDDISGEMAVSQSTSSDSYVGFGTMDDEAVAAIRNELLTKLPQAQGASAEKVEEDEEFDFCDSAEMIHLRYNLFKAPLSPIQEESLSERNSGSNTPRRHSEDNSDWSDEEQQDTESQSAHTCGSPIQVQLHRHTPSLDSCCSNDTLFNLEELTCVTSEQDRQSDNSPSTNTGHKDDSNVCPEPITHSINNESSDLFFNDANNVNEPKAEACDKISDVTCLELQQASSKINDNCDGLKICSVSENKNNSDINVAEENLKDKCVANIGSCENDKENIEEMQKTPDSSLGYITHFLDLERKYVFKVQDLSTNSESNTETQQSTTTDNLLPYKNHNVAPLPSPEDKPWKQLPASLLSYDKIHLPTEENESNDSEESPENLSEQIIEDDIQDSNSDENHVHTSDTTHTYETVAVSEEEMQPDNENIPPVYENLIAVEENTDPDYVNIAKTPQDYENVFEVREKVQPEYDSVPDIDDIYNEADYVNIVNLENSKNIDYVNAKNMEQCSDKEADYVNSYSSELIISNEVEEDSEDVFGVLTDIRFTGPGDQLMSTSFSESNELNDEQDWDSGSDTRSSSSGEFIWKEGEHEESLKALRAAPQDVTENVKPMEEIGEESSDSGSSCTDEEGESPEFVPSAWDKYATPTKSALRSPEKTMEKTEKKKSKGVWFKKQKYHCVYEYPREPDSPVLQSFDLWRPQTDFSSFTDWEFDTDTFVPSATTSDDLENSQTHYQPKATRKANLYQLTSVPDFTSSSGLDDEFYVSSSSKPFEVSSGISSQFFPGNNNWFKTENMTPDSGVEDITPASLTDGDDFQNMSTNVRSVPTLKTLVTAFLDKEKQMKEIKSNDVLGGLRHTRNKLKLDLPPSPSAFTSSKVFSIEPNPDPIVVREKPSFTTFGKSRFLVQHVDTPPSTEPFKSKNVSFEALPYKPLQREIVKDQTETTKSKAKSNVEIVRGEASLLDSADEDSGIESSTLERKLSSSLDDFD